MRKALETDKRISFLDTTMIQFDPKEDDLLGDNYDPIFIVEIWGSSQWGTPFNTRSWAISVEEGNEPDLM